MRLLVAGDWHSELHEEVAGRSLRALGHQVEEFKWHPYFQKPRGTFRGLVHLLRRLQNKYIYGPIIDRINKDLIARVIAFQPDALFVYRGTHITAASLRKVKELLPNCILVGYNNDDPFAPDHARLLWRHFLRALPEYDLMLAYRHANLEEYKQSGTKNVELMRSWFVPERNHPVGLTDDERQLFESDVVFVGHYETDQRLEYLEAIADMGYSLRIFGPGYDWDPVLKKSSALSHLVPISLVWGEDYNKALCGAKIALCFFSKLNRDTYTRRCFEIPATKTLMLSEHSSDLANLYQEGIEVELFDSKETMLAKIEKHLSDHEGRKKIACAGFDRVWKDGHDVNSRMRQLIGWITQLQHSIYRSKV